MTSKNPLIHRITRHRALSILFRSAAGLSTGRRKGAWDEGTDQMTGSPSQIRAALIDPSSALPTGQVIEPWNAYSVEPARIPAYPSGSLPPGFSGSSLPGSQGRLPSSAQKIEGSGSLTTSKIQPTGRLAGIKTTPSQQSLVDPQPVSNQPPEQEESEAEKASWTRLEAIYNQHKERRAVVDTELSAGSPPEDKDTTIKLPAKDSSGGDPTAVQPSDKPKVSSTDRIDPLEKSPGDTTEGEYPGLVRDTDISGEKPKDPEKTRPAPDRRSPRVTPASSAATIIAREPADDPTVQAEALPAGLDQLSGASESPPGQDQEEHFEVASKTDHTVESSSPRLAHHQDDSGEIFSGQPAQQERPGPGPRGGGDAALPTGQQSIPLEAVWPVERQVEDPLVRGKSPAGSKTGGESSTSSSSPPVGDKTTGAGSPGIPPGQPTESAIEILPPSRPRPQIQTPPAGRIPEREHLEGKRGDLSQAKRAEPKDSVDNLAPSEPIETDIGPLPADLWALIGKTPPEAGKSGKEQRAAVQAGHPAPVTEADPVQRAIQAAERPPQQKPPLREAMLTGPSTRRAGPAPRPVQTDSWTQPPVQRVAKAEPETQQSNEAETAPDNALDIEALARQVYPEIRRRLSLEWERTRRGY